MADAQRDTGEEWMDQEGVLVGTPEGETHAVARALDEALALLGFVAHADGAPPPADAVWFQRFAGASDGGWLLGRLDSVTARSLAARLAHLTKRPAWFLVARATFAENRKPACVFRAHEGVIEPDGRAATAKHPVLDDLEWSVSDLDTDHPWRVVELTLDQAIDAWIGSHAPPEQMAWRPPPKLSSPRLEAIARQLRAGTTVERVVVGGRPALKIRGHDGSVSTSVLSSDEIDLVLASAGRAARP